MIYLPFIDQQSSNSSKGNKEFIDKNEKYFKRAPFETQNELEDFMVNSSWSDESIVKRKEVLIKFALTQWKADKT